MPKTKLGKYSVGLCGAFIVINDEGWILTTAHIFNSYINYQQHRQQIQKYKELPFTTRWLVKDLNNFPVGFALKSLLQEKVIRAYPSLVEVKKGLVSQSEHTLLVTKDGCEILTKLERHGSSSKT